MLVQGAGSVGGRSRSCSDEAGANVFVADVDAARAGRSRRRRGTRVDAATALETECDVYAPCALGATLSATSIPTLRCRIVAGSANNQLARPEDAELLQAAEILYAPDYVINAGGAIAINYLELNGRSQDDVDAALAKIGDTLTEIYADAEAKGITTAAAADALAAARLSGS